MLTGATTLAILVWIIWQLCTNCIVKAQKRQQIRAMASFNTIEVGPSPFRHNASPGGAFDSNSQHGLMGGPSIAGVNDDDFADGKDQARRKMKINEAIEDQDDGKKGKGRRVIKKKKKGPTKSGNADMLNVEQVDGNESWESNRHNANVVDLSNTMGMPNETPSGLNSRKKYSGMGGVSGMSAGMNAHQEYYGGMSHNASAEQLSVADQLAGIEDIEDNSARGGTRGDYGGDFGG